MSIKSFEIGTTYAGRVNVETMTTKADNMSPMAGYFAYAESVPTLDAGATTRGFPYATWSWSGFIYADQFTALRALCPSGSASVIIRTTGADYSTYGYYSATMIWPSLDSYEQISTAHGIAYRTFTIRFNKLTVYTP